MPTRTNIAAFRSVVRSSASAWVLICAVFWPQLAHACPMCFNGNSQNSDAFVYGSLFLMFVPTAALGSLGYWAYRRIVAADRASMPLPHGADDGVGGDGSGPKGGPVVLRVVERR